MRSCAKSYRSLRLTRGFIRRQASTDAAVAHLDYISGITQTSAVSSFANLKSIAVLPGSE